MRYLKLLFLVIVLGMCFSCEKDILKENAIVTWRGDWEEGCSFFISIGDKTYKPKNESIIDESYKIIDDVVSVEIKYKLLNEKIICHACPNDPENPGISAYATDAIEIISIKKK